MKIQEGRASAETSFSRLVSRSTVSRFAVLTAAKSLKFLILFARVALPATPSNIANGLCRLGPKIISTFLTQSTILTLTGRSTCNCLDQMCLRTCRSALT